MKFQVGDVLRFELTGELRTVVRYTFGDAHYILEGPVKDDNSKSVVIKTQTIRRSWVEEDDRYTLIKSKEENDMSSSILSKIKSANSTVKPGASAIEVLSSNANFFEDLSKQEKSAAVAPPEPEVIKPPIKLEENQVLFTTITKGKLPASGKDWVIDTYPAGTWDADHSLNIKPVDPYYQWDPEVLEALILARLTGQKCLLVGPPGTGKTTAAQQFSAWLKQPFARFNGKDGIEPSAFLGYAWATSSGMEWKDGLLPQAVEKGYMVVIDEIFKLSPGVQMSLQSLYETGGFLMLDEKPGTIKDKHIYPAPTFFLVATDNTKGTGDGLESYAAGQMQDTSSLDRFGITKDVGYLDKESEKNMLKVRYPGVPVPDISRAVNFANLVRRAFLINKDLSLTFSPRGLCVTMELMQHGVGLSEALKLAYVNKLGDESEIQVASKFISDAI
jgi:MoxR-like ATPase